MGFFVIGFIVAFFGLVVKGSAKNAPNKGQAILLGNGLMGLGIIVAIVGALFASAVVVKAGYVGVRLRLGAVSGQLPEGFHMVIPGVDQVELVEVRTQKDDSKATAASRDLQTVTTDIALNYRVDPTKVGNLYKNVGTEYKSRIIDPAVQEAIKVVTAKYTAENLIREREKVKGEVEALITRRLKTFDLLVETGGLSITNFEFSEEFNSAIESKQVAQQEAEKQKYVLQQAELEQQTKVARAKGEAEAAKLNAESLRAQGGSLVIAREWIEKWDGHLPQVSGGADSGGFIIDISSLQKQAQTQ